MENNILFSSVDLDAGSIKKIQELFDGLIPKDFLIYMHHMTIMFGGIPPELENRVGETIELTVNGVGIGDRKEIFALRVDDVNKLTTNKIPHITIAAKNGVKPVESNNIKKWFKLTPFKVKGIITVNKKKNKERVVNFFDFDGTLINSPMPEDGKGIWEKYYKKPYPHKGWWSKKESLDTDVFDIKPFPSIVNILNKYGRKGDVNYILTNRLHKLFLEISKIIDNNSIFVEDIYMKNDGYHMSDKFTFILNFMKENTQYKKVRFYDDDIDTINTFKDNLDMFKEIGVNIEVFWVKKGNIKKI